MAETLGVEWHDQTATFEVNGWHERYPTAEHMVHILERRGFDIDPQSYDKLFDLDQEVSREVGDALLVANSSNSLIGVVTPMGQVSQVTHLGDGINIPAIVIASMVAPATFTARSVARQLDIDAVSSDMAEIVGSMIERSPLKVRALQVWGIAQLGSDSSVAQRALEEAVLIEPTQIASARKVVDAHLWGPTATAIPNQRPTLRRPSHPPVEAAPMTRGA